MAKLKWCILGKDFHLEGIIHEDIHIMIILLDIMDSQILTLSLERKGNKDLLLNLYKRDIINPRKEIISEVQELEGKELKENNKGLAKLAVFNKHRKNKRTV